MDTLPQYDKGQGVRLWNILVFGPFLVWYATVHPQPAWAKALAVAMGIGALWGPGAWYLIHRRAESQSQAQPSEEWRAAQRVRLGVDVAVLAPAMIASGAGARWMDNDAGRGLLMGLGIATSAYNLTNWRNYEWTS